MRLIVKIYQIEEPDEIERLTSDVEEEVIQRVFVKIFDSYEDLALYTEQNEVWNVELLVIDESDDA